jgi:hypothetical protein
MDCCDKSRMTKTAMKKLTSILTTGLLLVAGSATAANLPTSHFIPNVPWHVQMNGLFCGDGSLEIVYDFWGPDIDQKAIADVARSSSIGTWSFDVQRAGHFSSLSAAQGSFFPNEAPTAGYPERPLGYAAFSHSAETPWLDDLKSLIAADIPVILLMTYAPDGTGGGHYRVAIGYDDAQGIMYFSDPWGRDLKYLPGMEGVIAWTYDEVLAAWNYAEYGTSEPYFGVAILPWSVDVRVKGKTTVGSTLTVTAMVNYPCPRPFDCTQFPASSASATIVLPEGMTLLDPPATSLDTLTAGTTKSVSWKIRIDTPVTGKAITVEAQGLVSGSVPEARWNGQSQVYPPYSYTDAIGGSGTYRF